ncbi:MAG: hypothetical protein V1800_09590 [Candidatus Latescibacterota bacterium]
MDSSREGRPPTTTVERINALRSISRIERTMDYVDKKVADAEIPVPHFGGERYEADVPDTLDLTDNARFAINAYTRMLDPAMDYQFFGNANFVRKPSVLILGGDYGCVSKHLEALPLVRIMSGSSYNIEMDKAFMECRLHLAGKDGFFYAPWSKVAWWPGYTVGGSIVDRTKQPYAGIWEEARMIQALCMWYQHDKNLLWKELIEKKINRLSDLAVWKEDYCYFSRGGGAHYVLGDKGPVEGPMLKGVYAIEPARNAAHSCSLYYRLTGYEPALKLAGGVVRALLEHGEAYGEDGRWLYFHFHANSGVLISILEYATTVNDKDLIDFVKRGYEFGKAFGEPLVGYYPEEIPTAERDPASRSCETCEVADMLVLGVMLSKAGAGDYWEDVDRCVRNQFVENQITRTDWVDRLSEGTHPSFYRRESQPTQLWEDETDAVERAVGSFAAWAMPNDGRHFALMQCCIGNAGRSLYYVWDSIVTKEGDGVKVNLLLNRASTWLDVDSHLPYEGKVALKIKEAENVAVRIPEWCDRHEVRCHVNGNKREFGWLGGYIEVKGLRTGDRMVVEFPIQERTMFKEIGGKPYRLALRGNTVVDISPEGTIYPLYQRDHYRQEKAPMKKITRFVSGETIVW